MKLVERGAPTVVYLCIQWCNGQSLIIVGERRFVAFELQKSATSVNTGIEKVRLQFYGCVEAGERVLRPLQIQQRIAAIVEGIGVLRIQYRCALENFKRVLWALEMTKDNPKI